MLYFVTLFTLFISFTFITLLYKMLFLVFMVFKNILRLKHIVYNNIYKISFHTIC